MRHLRLIGTVLALAAAAVTMTNSLASDGSSWIGTWVASWPDGATATELRIENITGGKVIGAYCHKDIGRPRKVRDLGGPNAPTQPRFEDDAIRWETTAHKGAPKRWEFRLESENTIRFRFRNQHNRTHIVMMQRHPGNSDCLGQWQPPTARDGRLTIAPADDENPWIGTWIGVWPRQSGRSEFRVDRIDDDGAVHGALCHANLGRPWAVWDIGPNDEIQAKRRGRGIRWQQTMSDGAPGEATWRLRRDHSGVDLTVRAKRKGKRRTGKLLFTRYISRCLDRWIARSEL